MKYECECGCGEWIEKTIAFSDACRMRIKRSPVRKTNKDVLESDKVVRKTNTIEPKVFDKRTDVQESVRNPNSDTVQVFTEGACPSCRRVGKETEEGWYCQSCNKRYD